MTDIYFGIKTFGFIFFLGLAILLFSIVIIKESINSFKKSRIRKYLTSIGYKRELISTAAFGTNHTYGYKKLKDNGWSDIIRDSELSGLTLKQVKQKYI